MAVVASNPQHPHLGQFLRAGRAFSQGELILQEDPILRIRGSLRRGLPLPQEVLVSVPELHEANLFVPEVSTSPTMQRLRQDQSAGGSSSELHSEAAFVSAILHFNSFSAGNAGRDQAVFKTLARANHSCMPNCIVDADLGTLRSLRNIAAGEELNLSYLDDAALLLPKRRRQEELFRRWEFRCSCKRCSAALDDVRRFSGRCQNESCDSTTLVVARAEDVCDEQVICAKCGVPVAVEQQKALFKSEDSAFANLRAARSGDLEEEEEGQELMRCHRFAAIHPLHSAAFELAHEFAFPDPTPARKNVLEGLASIFEGLPSQLAVETGRELAEDLLQKPGKALEAQRSFEEAARIACILDGVESIEEVLREWGRSVSSSVSATATVQHSSRSPDMEAILGEAPASKSSFAKGSKSCCKGEGSCQEGVDTACFHGLEKSRPERSDVEEDVRDDLSRSTLAGFSREALFLTGAVAAAAIILSALIRKRMK